MTYMILGWWHRRDCPLAGSTARDAGKPVHNARMIVRADEDSYVLINQHDHAQLARDIVAAMRTEPALLGARRDLVLHATREHDNGWLETDAQPTITEAGRPCDFIEGPAPVKHEIWPRGIARAGNLDPRVGALVAEHALTVYAYRRQESEWLPFFTSVSALRDALLRDARVDTEMALREFRMEYRCVRLGDSFSLQFCNGWTDPQDTLGYRAALRGSRLFISPDPFDGVAIPLQVPARRIAGRMYRDDEDLRAAVDAAAPELLIGEARGVQDITSV